ncbi:hypothetical protein ARMGADRAFT_928406, partial [Armillaria gallica]
WNQLNPSWRCSLTSGGLPRSDYTSKSLLALRKGGQYGLVTVVLGLYWWGKGRQAEDNWLGMVNDVANVIDVVLCPERKRTGQKRSIDSSREGSAKRIKV